MAADRYLKFILTLIACELLWLGVKDAAPRASAQTAPTPVVITGIQLGQSEYLPVAVRGSMREDVSPRPRDIEPLRAQVMLDPATVLRIDSSQPLTVQTGARPLMVQSIEAQPKARPGLGPR
jgi:hypothetical protein